MTILILVRLLADKFLNVGYAPNGDLLVLDFSTEACVPGFICNDQFWGGDHTNSREFFQPIARTFESLLYRISEGRYIPTDYYAAFAFNKFLDEERKSNL